MAVGSGGYLEAPANRQLMPEQISRSPGTARLPLSISSLTTSPTESRPERQYRECLLEVCVIVRHRAQKKRRIGPLTRG